MAKLFQIRTSSILNFEWTLVNSHWTDHHPLSGRQWNTFIVGSQRFQVYISCIPHVNSFIQWDLPSRHNSLSLEDVFAYLTPLWIGNEVQLFPIIPPCRVCTVAVAQGDADTCTEDSQTSHLTKWCVSCDSCNKLSHSSQWTWFCLTCFINRNQRFSFNKGQGFNELTHASVNVTDLSFFTFSDPFKVTLWCLSKRKLVSSPLIDGRFFWEKPQGFLLWSTNPRFSLWLPHELNLSIQ